MVTGAVTLPVGVVVGVGVDVNVDVGVWVVAAAGSKVAVTVGLANGSMGVLCIKAVTAETVSIGVIVGVSLFPGTTSISESIVVGVIVAFAKVAFAKILSFPCKSAELPETFAKSSK